jgi:hypothetical protein
VLYNERIDCRRLNDQLPFTGAPEIVARARAPLKWEFAGSLRQPFLWDAVLDAYAEESLIPKRGKIGEGDDQEVDDPEDTGTGPVARAYMARAAVLRSHSTAFAPASVMSFAPGLPAPRRKTYWIDPSCDQMALAGPPYRTMDSYIQEAMNWARRALIRLRSEMDTDFHRVFNVIMKTPLADTEIIKKSDPWSAVHENFRTGFQDVQLTAREHVESVLQDFSAMWVRTSSLQDSDLRISCNQRREHTCPTFLLLQFC